MCMCDLLNVFLYTKRFQASFCFFNIKVVQKYGFYVYFIILYLLIFCLWNFTQTILTEVKVKYLVLYPRPSKLNILQRD